MRAAVTNHQVGDLIGLSHSAVSRIRSGERKPSVGVMNSIQKEFGWSAQAQINAHAEGKYASEFEDILVEQFGEVPAESPRPQRGPADLSSLLP